MTESENLAHEPRYPHIEKVRVSESAIRHAKDWNQDQGRKEYSFIIEAEDLEAEDPAPQAKADHIHTPRKDGVRLEVSHFLKNGELRESFHDHVIPSLQGIEIEYIEGGEEP